MSTATLEILIIIALATVFFIILRRLPVAKEMIEKAIQPITSTNPPAITAPEPPKPDPRELLEKKLADIERQIESNNLGKAEEALLELVVHNTKNGDIYEKLGLVYLKRREYADSISSLNEALKYKKDLNGRIYDGLGLAHFGLKEYLRSIEHLKKGIELDKTNIPRYIHLSEAQKGFGRAMDAKRTIQRAQKVEPDNIDLKKLSDTLS